MPLPFPTQPLPFTSSTSSRYSFHLNRTPNFFHISPLHRDDHHQSGNQNAKHYRVLQFPPYASMEESKLHPLSQTLELNKLSARRGCADAPDVLRGFCLCVVGRELLYVNYSAVGESFVHLVVSGRVVVVYCKNGFLWFYCVGWSQAQSGGFFAIFTVIAWCEAPRGAKMI